MNITTRQMTWEQAANKGYVECLLDGSRGIYLPQQFAEIIDYDDYVSRWGLTDMREDIDILLAGPDHEHYWDAWQDIMDNAEFTDDQRRIWHLWQDDDLFVVCSQHGDTIIEIEDM